MKEIYSFDVERKVESSKPVAKKVKGVTVESVEKSIKSIKHRVVFAKPSMSMIEEAEFFYGQKFNELINAGFFTKAMLNKKMGDIGGLSSKTTIESLQKAISDNMEASRVIEFYGASKTLSDEQKEKLEEAKLTFSSTKSQVIDYEQAVRSQFSQTADVKDFSHFLRETLSKISVLFILNYARLLKILKIRIFTKLKLFLMKLSRFLSAWQVSGIIRLQKNQRISRKLWKKCLATKMVIPFQK